MDEFLNSTYYGNTISIWLISGFIFLAFALFSRAIYWFFSTIVRKWTKKTENKLDDVIIDMIEEPIMLTIGLIGLWSGFNFLTFHESVFIWFKKIFHVFLSLNIAWLVSRLVDSLFKEYLIPLANKTESDLDDVIYPVARTGSKTIIWMIGLIVGLNNAGYDVGALLAGMGIGGIALAMASKDTISNMFGGFTIFTDQPFKITDRIKIKGFDGTVKEIGLRSTRLQTQDGTIVSIPNSSFADNPVENVTLEPSRKISSNIILSSTNPTEKVQIAMDLLKKAASNNKNLDAKVTVYINKFTALIVELTFVYYILKGQDIYQTQTEIQFEIIKQFSLNEIKLA